jgi:hypothetical protein
MMDAMAGSFAATAMAMRNRGWQSLVPITPAKKRPCISEWQRWGTTPPSPAQIAAWGVQYPDAGLGLVYGGPENVLAVDLDWLDDRAYAAWAKTKSLLGPTPLVREGLHPKKLMLYRFEPPLVLPGKAFGNFEIFHAAGTQTVFAGVHPDTGAPYRWIAGATPADIGPQELPLVTPAQVLALIDALRPLCGDAPVKSGKGSRSKTPRVYAPSGQGASDRTSGTVASVISDLREHAEPMVRAIEIVRHSTPGNRYPNAFGCTVALVRMGYSDAEINAQLVPAYAKLFLPSEHRQRVDALQSALRWARGEIGEDAKALTVTAQAQSIESWWRAREGRG